METNERPMVSIVMPVYNCEQYLKETLDSVLSQSYDNWECICTDDCSTDNSYLILNEYEIKDTRIKVYRLDRNSGAASARNNCIKYAEGEYLAFLDSDDVWKKEKLQTQLSFMIENNYDLTCTSYGKMDGESNVLSKKCLCKPKYTYEEMLKNCPGNSTMIYNCKKIGKVLSPNIKRRNDFAMWLQVIKKTDAIYGLQEVLSYHRIRDNSISSDKKLLVKYQYEVYRKIEGMSAFKSMYLLFYKVLQTVLDKNG